jgi:hypothetical protein
MASTYPGGIASFTRKIDNVDTVIASDVNVLYDEVEEIERQLSGVNNGSFGGSIATSNSWGSGNLNVSRTDWYQYGGLAGRIQNIEYGVYKAVTSIDGGTAASNA